MSAAFYNHEMEAEIRERNIQWQFKGNDDDARDEFMNFVEKKRRIELYNHPATNCSTMCKERGCVNNFLLKFYGSVTCNFLNVRSNSFQGWLSRILGRSRAKYQGQPTSICERRFEI